MPWGLFSAALLVVYLLQTAVLPHLAPPYLDLFMTFALLCGLTGLSTEARLAAWLIGLAQDIGSSAPLGTHALALGFAGLLITRLREMLNRELWWVRWLLGFAAAVPALLLVQIHARFVEGAALTWPQMLGYSLITAAISALLAAVTLRLPRLFRRRHLYSADRW